MNQNDYMFKNVEDWEETLGYRVTEGCRIAFNMGRLKWGKLADSIQDNAEVGGPTVKGGSPE